MREVRSAGGEKEAVEMAGGDGRLLALLLGPARGVIVVAGARGRLG